LTGKLRLATLIAITALGGCDQRILGEYGYNGNSYKASYEGDIVIRWRGAVVRSKRYIDEFVQTLPPDKGYISYSYNAYIALDSDTVAWVNISPDIQNRISYRYVYQRDIDANGKPICRELSPSELSGPQFTLSIVISPLAKRPPDDNPPPDGITLPPGPASCSAMIRNGLVNTEFASR